MKTNAEGTQQTTDFKIKSKGAAKKVMSIINSMDEVLPILSHSWNVTNTFAINGKKAKAKKVKAVLNELIESTEKTKTNKKKAGKKENNMKKKSVNNKRESKEKPIKVRRSR